MSVSACAAGPEGCDRRPVGELVGCAVCGEPVCDFHGSGRGGDDWYCPAHADEGIAEALCPACERAGRAAEVVDADCSSCPWTGRVRIHRHAAFRRITDDLELYATCPGCGARGTLRDPEGL